jgi:hypothetical protein
MMDLFALAVERQEDGGSRQQLVQLSQGAVALLAINTNRANVIALVSWGI